MNPQEKLICPACNKAIKVGIKFCTNCGVMLSEFNGIETIIEDSASASPDTATEENKLINGWDVSPDRIKKYRKMMAQFPLVDPIITSKCRLAGDPGFLVVNDYGIAWRFQRTFIYRGAESATPKYTRVWIRWYDVANIIPKKKGEVLVVVKRRKKGVLKLDKGGRYKLKRIKFKINRNKGEQKSHFKQRQDSYNDIMLEIFNRNRVEVDPPIGDSQLK